MSDINPVGFGPTVGMLTDALTGAGMQGTAIAENIANVNTPNYRRQSVSFKGMLSAAQGLPPSGDELALTTDSARQFGGPPAGSAQPFDPTISTDNSSKMRVDGSNVDLDQEMAQLSQNSGYSQTMAQLLQVQFMRLRQAITETF